MCKKASGTFTSDGLNNYACSHEQRCANTVTLRDELIEKKGAGTETHVKILWSGHAVELPDRANAGLTSKTIIIPPSHSNNDYVFMHELAHLMDAPDHYCYGKINGQDCENDDCIECNDGDTGIHCIMYNSMYITYSDQDIFCSACQSIINSHLRSHH